MNGINKLAAEKYHRLYHRVHGLRTLSLRLGNTRALEGQAIELFGGGMQTRDYTFVADAAEAFRLAILRIPGNGEHYFIGSNFEASLREVAQMIVSAAGAGSIVEKPYPPGVKVIEVSRFKTDFGKVHAATGWQPKVSLPEGIRRTVEFYRDRLADYT
jgi:nucleoside-diphosphate-sugar epimerase